MNPGQGIVIEIPDRYLAPKAQVKTGLIIIKNKGLINDLTRFEIQTLAFESYFLINGKSISWLFISS